MTTKTARMTRREIEELALIETGNQRVWIAGSKTPTEAQEQFLAGYKLGAQTIIARLVERGMLPDYQ